ncbi:glycosyltransferase [Mycobacterium sp. HUMS_1102779]|uniref:glycosyltransferase n=1 Tax=Mycobacterium sp. HUMS_1102779 TaxID=3383487 RepID=UPI00389A89BD
MKIAIVCGDDQVGDDPRQVCAALAARGHDVTAYVRRAGRRREGAGGGDRVVPLPVGPRGPVSAPEVLPYVGDWAAALQREWSSDQPDVVHAYGWLGGLAAQLAARRQRIPTVQSFQGVAAARRPDGSPHESERERIEPLLARSATWVTGESSADVDALARLRRSRARMSVLASGVDGERFAPVGPVAPRGELNRVLCVAPNPLWCNGFDRVIRALPRLAGTELVLAETAPADAAHVEARAQLEELAAELGVADRVRFAGTLPEDELPQLIRSANVFACTPRQPPRPTTVLQAMACGVAVVALPVGFLTEAIVDNVTGLLLSPERPGELTAALRALLAQSFQRESMGSAGRSRALSRFTWDRVALDALNIYRQIGSERLPSHPLQSAGLP